MTAARSANASAVIKAPRTTATINPTDTTSSRRRALDRMRRLGSGGPGSWTAVNERDGAVATEREGAAIVVVVVGRRSRGAGTGTGTGRRRLVAG